MAGETKSTAFALIPLDEPWRALRVYDDLVSTQNFAGECLDLGEDLGGFAIQARRQTKGRGRFERSWVSGEGGVYVTACLPQSFPAPWELAGWLPLAAALVCAQWIRDTLKLPAELKWPNDVLIDGRKVAGTLGEMRARGRALMGLGLNWSNEIAGDASAGGFAAASLAEWRPRLRPESQIEFLRPWLAGLSAWADRLLRYTMEAEGELAEEAAALLGRRGETVRLEKTEQGAVEGMLLGFGARGSARLRMADGTIRDVHCGWTAPEQ